MFAINVGNVTWMGPKGARATGISCGRYTRMVQAIICCDATVLVHVVDGVILFYLIMIYLKHSDDDCDSKQFLKRVPKVMDGHFLYINRKVKSVSNLHFRVLIIGY